jgi:hypothetical protein
MIEICHFLTHSLNLTHHRYGSVDAANNAAVPQPHTSRNHFEWVEAAENAVGMVKR